jgi:hypothetical protein
MPVNQKPNFKTNPKTSPGQSHAHVTPKSLKKKKSRKAQAAMPTLIQLAINKQPTTLNGPKPRTQ